MPSTFRIVVALAFGLAAGAAIGQNALLAVSSTAHVIAGLWLNSLRLTVAPLIFLLLATGAATLGESTRRRLAMALGPVAMLFATAALGAAARPDHRLVRRVVPVRVGLRINDQVAA